MVHNSKIPFIVNAKGSKRTAWYWRRHQKALREAFQGSEFLVVDAKKMQGLGSYLEFDQLVLVGTDPFFSLAINQIFGERLTQGSEQVFAFLPTSRESSIAASLELPFGLKQQIDLITLGPQIPFDLIRCHCISPEGLPKSYLVLNDALIRLPHLKLPLLFRTVVQFMRTHTGLGAKAPSKITLFERGVKFFEGEYLFSIILLGNKITGGPKLLQKRRFMVKNFHYYQLNGQGLREYTSALPKLFSTESENPALFKGKYTELELRGLGEENRIVADGNLIGRLPASFTLLPKAIKVISPLSPIQRVEPVQSRVATQAKPVGNLKLGA